MSQHNVMRRLFLTLVLASAACGAYKDAPPEGVAATPAGRSIPTDSASPMVAAGNGRSAAQPAPPAVPDSIRRPQAPRVATPNPIRGLYVNRWAALGRKMWELIDIAKRTE